MGFLSFYCESTYCITYVFISVGCLDCSLNEMIFSIRHRKNFMLFCVSLRKLLTPDFFIRLLINHAGSRRAHKFYLPNCCLVDGLKYFSPSFWIVFFHPIFNILNRSGVRVSECRTGKCRHNWDDSLSCSSCELLGLRRCVWFVREKIITEISLHHLLFLLWQEFCRLIHWCILALALLSLRIRNFSQIFFWGFWRENITVRSMHQ